ncbi:MAG: transposase [Planctomycetes bacterium]|nr:transposase [Planctomycetota bacterium]
MLDGDRKSIEPMAGRLTAIDPPEKDYVQALRQFINQSNWEDSLVQENMRRRIGRICRPRHHRSRRRLRRGRNHVHRPGARASDAVDRWFRCCPCRGRPGAAPLGAGPHQTGPASSIRGMSLSAHAPAWAERPGPLKCPPLPPASRRPPLRASLSGPDNAIPSAATAA